MLIFLKTKSVPNIHQNALNCTISKKILVGACPRTLRTKRMASPCCKFSDLKNNYVPPLPNPGYAPVNYHFLKSIKLKKRVANCYAWSFNYMK